MVDPSENVTNLTSLTLDMGKPHPTSLVDGGDCRAFA